jgi:hypothetical protein
MGAKPVSAGVGWCTAEQEFAVPGCEGTVGPRIIPGRFLAVIVISGGERLGVAISVRQWHPGIPAVEHAPAADGVGTGRSRLWRCAAPGRRCCAER